MFIVTPFASRGSLSCFPSSKKFLIYLATSSCFFSTNFLWIWKIAFIGWNNPSGSFNPPHEFNYNFCVCMCLRVEICLKINCDSWTADVKVLGLVYDESPMLLSCIWRRYGKKWKVAYMREAEVWGPLRRGISYVKEIIKSARNWFIVFLIRLQQNWSINIWYMEWGKKRLKLVAQQQKALHFGNLLNLFPFSVRDDSASACS
jgi:hypothetical protein